MMTVSALIIGITPFLLFIGLPGLLLACPLFAVAIFLHPFSSHIKKMIKCPMGLFPYFIAGLVPVYTFVMALIGTETLNRAGKYGYFPYVVLISYYFAYKIGKSIFKGTVINKFDYSPDKYDEKESPEEGNGYLLATVIVIAIIPVYCLLWWLEAI